MTRGLLSGRRLVVDGNPVATELVRRFGAQEFSFEELPKEARAAAEAYFEEPEALVYGLTLVPREAMEAAVLQTSEELSSEFSSFEAYHAWYPGKLENHSTVWPVIFAPNDFELLQDGWHRLHTYHRQHRPIISAIWVTRRKS